MKKAVIFDLDGTLSDTIRSIKYCLDLALVPFGYGTVTEDECKYFAGDGAANLVKRALASKNVDAEAHFEEVFAEYKKVFRVHCMHDVKPFDGIVELIGELKERGVKIAVLSNKPHAETVSVIETLFGKGTFDVILGQTDHIAIKPDPAGAFEIFKQLKLSAEDVLYLGDTSTDMRTGKGSGAFTIGVLWGFRPREELEEYHADAIIAHPLEALQYL